MSKIKKIFAAFTQSALCVLLTASLVLGFATSAFAGNIETVEAGPIWSNADAQGKCPATCENYDSGYKWNGQWWTTEWGEMSVCQCAKSPVAIEAGPIWSNDDAQGKCPTTCSDAGFGYEWDGQWWTTEWGEMSVCECVV
ncbi:MULTISPECIES: mannan-binding lectin [unclassified Moorena]|uniref:mannan-binding lectin n=1 Tax=unclassified Moorena TaxID=2683338 RepID=UPI0014008426|nr:MULTISPECIES: mannan-binding lectin [unclassified Moorena]NEO17388.1 hypothetical protein [Moorena sp. SIO3E8]NEQ03945.1 hypothetical protein [Moorena sp. SIO3F7]